MQTDSQAAQPNSTPDLAVEDLVRESKRLVSLAKLPGAIVRQEQSARAAGAPMLEAQVDASLAEAESRLWDAVEALVIEGGDQVIDEAMARLAGPAHEEQVAYDQLAGALDSVTLDHYSVEGEPLELHLIPIIVACPGDGTATTLPSEAIDVLLDTWDMVFGNGNLLYIDPKLWAASDVYSLSYRDILELTPSLPEDDATPQATVFQNTEVYQGLRFLAIWAFSNDADPTLQLGGSEDDPSDGLDACDEQMFDDALERTESILEEVTGRPVIAEDLSDIYEARKAGMALFTQFSARTAISLQLEMEGYAPEGGGATIVIYSAHGTPDKAIPENGIVRVLRASVLNSRGDMLARHSIELNPWLGLGIATDIMADLAETYGASGYRLLDGLQDLASEPASDPVYFQGAQFVTDGFDSVPEQDSARGRRH